MAEETAEFTQGEPGVNEQMGQGEATELNEGLELAREMDRGTQDVEAMVPSVGAEGEERDDSMDEASPADFEGKLQPGNEDMKFVTGPTMKPSEAQWVGAMSAAGKTSSRARRHLSTLQKVASEPGASPNLQRLVRWMIENS